MRRFWPFSHECSPAFPLRRYPSSWDYSVPSCDPKPVSYTHLDVYKRQTGFSLEELAFYDAFACFKFAVITQGVFVRALHGDMAGQDFGKLTGEVAALADEGLAYLE